MQDIFEFVEFPTLYIQYILYILKEISFHPKYKIFVYTVRNKVFSGSYTVY